MKFKKLSKVVSLALVMACAVSLANPLTASAATNKTDTAKKYSNVGTSITSTSRTANNSIKVKVKLALPKGKTLVVNDIRKRFIIIKGYFNRSALKYPFFHLWVFAAGNPLCKPPLALQVPSGKGVDRLFRVWQGWKNRLPDNLRYAIIGIRSRRVTRW